MGGMKSFFWGLPLASDNDYEQNTVFYKNLPSPICENFR